MTLAQKQATQPSHDPVLIVGRITEVNGGVMVTRIESGPRRLHLGDPIFRGDVFETQQRSWVTLSFDDGTEMTLGAEARMSLDRYFFDQATASGVLDACMLTGSFYVTSGVMTADPQSLVVIRTPNAVTKLPPPRGVLAGKYIAQDEVSLFTLLADDFGRAGNAEVSTREGRVRLTRANQTTVVSSFNRAPTRPAVLTRLDLFDLFGLFRDRGWQYARIATRRFRRLSERDQPRAPHDSVS